MTTQKMLSTRIAKQDLITDRSCDILLVDDNPNILAIMSACLEKKGSSITKASDGRAGLEAIKKNSYDLVITDLKMPGANGFAILKEAKRINPDTIVIIASGNQQFESAIEALHLGADSYLLKPFGVDELYRHINQCFEKLEQKKRNMASDEYLRTLK